MASGDESDEEDFMSDAFLVQAEQASTSSSSTSYSERRRKQLNAAHDKGKTISRAERERVARQQGMARSLLQGKHEQRGAAKTVEVTPSMTTTRKRKGGEDGSDEDTGDRIVAKQRKHDEGQGQSKALRMMLAMGFTPGEALGKQADSRDAKGAVDAPSSVPIALDERWLGARRRAGIGRLPPSSAVAMHVDIATAADEHAALQHRDGTLLDAATADFRARARQEHDLRHAEALLARARKTCQELDVRQLDMTYSPLWLNPDALHKRTDELPQHVAQLIDFAFAGLGEETTAEAEAETAAQDDKESNDITTSKQVELAEPPADEESKHEATQDDEAAAAVARTDEARRFCSLPAMARLQITLSHLRRAHFYCLYCGHRYVSDEELNEQCAGEEEDDH